VKLKSGKFISAVVVVLIVAVGGGWWWKHRQADAPQYQTTVVASGPLTQTVTATGQMNPVINVLVGSQISGTIAKLYADYNSQVTNGQVIAQIDSATYRANVQQAEAELASAKAGQMLARVNADRAQQLLTDRLVPQADFDQAQANLQQAEAAVKLKEATLERTRTDLARCTISSPIDGMVVSRNVDVGQTVAASLSAPTLFVIANDLTKMQIDANVSEADIGGVEVGQDVDFTVDAFPDRTFHGKVVQIRAAPITVQSVVTYDTVIAVNNPDLKLRPGMTANVSVITAHRDATVKIPNAALRFRPPNSLAGSAKKTGPNAVAGRRPTGASSSRPMSDRPRERTVYLLPANSNQLQPVQIKTGISDGVDTEVVAGLKEGDVIVTGLKVISSTAAQPASPFGGMRRF
jgi:HlyD family secretion protein